MWRFTFTTDKNADITTYTVETKHFSPNLAALIAQHNHPEFNPAEIISLLAIKVGEK